MNGHIFQDVNTALLSRLPEVLADLLPGGRVRGREYICGSLAGGAGDSCSTSLETGKGSDFATGETWGDVIALPPLEPSIRIETPLPDTEDLVEAQRRISISYVRQSKGRPRQIFTLGEMYAANEDNENNEKTSIRP